MDQKRDLEFTPSSFEEMARKDYEYIRAFQCAIEVSKKKTLEKKFIAEILNVESFRLNPLLRINDTYLIEFLNNIELETRVLFYVKSSGQDLFGLSIQLGYRSTTLLQKFMGKKIDRFQMLKFLARFAIFFRTSPMLFIEEAVSNEWDTYHFHWLGEKEISYKDFAKIINNAHNNENWFRGIIIRGPSSKFMFLRVECRNGNFLIEVFNNEVDSNDYLALMDILRGYKTEYGTIITYIKNKYIPAIICLKYSQPYCVPVEYRIYKL